MTTRLLPVTLLLCASIAGCSDPDDDAPADLSQQGETAFANTPIAEAVKPEPQPEPEPEIFCDCELSSWIVAARGRHLHLDIDCPEEFDYLDGRIEYTSAALRVGFDPSLLPEGALPPLARMTPGYHLMSPMSEPQPRSEATYTVTPAVAAWMQRDLVFSEPYILLGSNSNAAMRAMLEGAGLELPEHVLNGKGVFGEFPGIDKVPGTEIPADQWADYGLQGGPTVIDESLPEGWDTLPGIGVNQPSEEADEGSGA